MTMRSLPQPGMDALSQQPDLAQGTWPSAAKVAPILDQAHRLGPLRQLVRSAKLGTPACQTTWLVATPRGHGSTSTTKRPQAAVPGGQPARARVPGPVVVRNSATDCGLGRYAGAMSWLMVLRRCVFGGSHRSRPGNQPCSGRCRGLAAYGAVALPRAPHADVGYTDREAYIPGRQS